MLTLPARPLILTCGAAIAIFDLVALLPRKSRRGERP
jgi:hypothetical protein